jgi:hypothetical protein
MSQHRAGRVFSECPWRQIVVVNSRLRIVAGAAAALTLAGCSSSSTSGAPASASADSSASSSSAPSSAAATTAAATTAAATTAPASSAVSGAGSIDDTYYPVAVGNTWVYSTDLGSLGKVTDTETMTAVTPSADGHLVTISRAFHYAGGQAKDFTSVVKYDFHRDGSLTVPFQSGVQTAGTIETVKSGSIVWPTPATLEAGTPTSGTIDVEVSTAGQTIDVKGTVTLKGAGKSSVTVPAGTFASAQLLDQNLTETIGATGTTVAIKTTAWLVKGTGMVKTTISGQAGVGTYSAVLVSFKHG